METITDEQIVAACKEILSDNRRGDYTIPAQKLYPHQWLWDSCFIAIGVAEFDVPRAQAELRSLVRGQWRNGMIPHMIFSSDEQYTRDRNIWQSWRNPNAPESLATSGMTQPPMLAEAVVRIGSKLEQVERREWYQDMFPSLVAYHEWLYNERDPHKEGLVFLLHPWESGLDNSPPWIDQLHQHGKPWWVRVIEKLKLDRLVLLFRRDTAHVPPGQRLSSIDALLYFSVMQRLKRKNWDTERILSRSHFTFQDLPYNCILIRANQHLKTIAETIGHPIPPELLERMQKSETELEKLWDETTGQYYSRNFVTHKLVKIPSIATLLPLYAGTISKERADKLVQLVNNANHYNTSVPLPTVPVSSTWYSELGYWQGPVWINTNWLIADGLLRYGYETEAETIIDSSIGIVRKHGPYEYFSAKSGQPAGAENFSWTASLIVAMVATKKRG